MDCKWRYSALILTSILTLTQSSDFSWRCCGDASDEIQVTSLDVFQNKSSYVYVSGSGKTGINLTAPIQGRVQAKKKVFWGWIDIPCIDGFGSCTYNDICALAPDPGTDCPESFKEHDLPCRCPVLVGKYTFKRIPISVRALPHWIEKGLYNLRIKLIQDDKRLLCLEMAFLFD